MSRRVVLALGALVLLGVVVVALSTRGSAARRGESARLRVPRFGSDVTFDGELTEPAWRASARTGAFVGSGGAPARPYSDARFGWRDGELYVGLYAADEDIGARDAFHLSFTTRDGVRAADVSPLGAIASDGWAAGARVAHDLDGTLDAPNDDDEEWVIEMALPLKALGARGVPGEEIPLAIDRCDTFHTGARECGAWRGTLVLE